jgi:hypothetical protein
LPVHTHAIEEEPETRRGETSDGPVAGCVNAVNSANMAIVWIELCFVLLLADIMVTNAT